jgi:hypothetical protein
LPPTLAIAKGKIQTRICVRPQPKNQIQRRKMLELIVYLVLHAPEAGLKIASERRYLTVQAEAEPISRRLYALLSAETVTSFPEGQLHHTASLLLQTGQTEQSLQILACWHSTCFEQNYTTLTAFSVE